MLFFGHSHIFALYRGATAEGLNPAKFYLADENKHVIKYSIDDMVLRFPKDKCFTPPVIFSFFGFDHIWTMTSQFTPFDFPSAGQKKFLPEAQIVPEKLVETYVSAFIKSFGFANYLDKAVGLIEGIYGKIPMYHLASPPPVRWPNIRPEDLPATRKVWLIANCIRREICEQYGITYIENPPECFDQEGFLPTALVEDLNHGNERYGRCVFQHMKKNGVIK